MVDQEAEAVKRERKREGEEREKETDRERLKGLPASSEEGWEKEEMGRACL